MLLMPGNKKKRLASLIVAKMTPSYVGKEKGGYDKEFKPKKDEEESESMALEAVCEKVIGCVKEGDAKGMASYMKDLFEMLESNEEVY